MRPQRENYKSGDNSREISVLRPVKAKRRQADAAYNEQQVRKVKAQHTRQQQRIAIERDLWKRERHGRAERRDEERKAEDSASPCEYPYRDKEQIYVAELERQLIEPVEFFKSGHLHKLRIDRQERLIGNI